MNRKKLGFSLIEFVVAFGITMILVLPLLEMTGAFIKLEGSFYRKYGIRGNLSDGSSSGDSGDVQVIDGDLASLQTLLKNFMKNAKKLGFNDSPPINSNSGYEGLKSFADDDPKIGQKGYYTYTLNWEAVGGSKCNLSSVSGAYYLTYTGVKPDAKNVMYSNPGAAPSIYSCYTYYGAKDLNNKNITLTITNGSFINMLSLASIWNPSTQKGNANLPAASVYNFVKIGPNPEFLYLEAILETGEVEDAIVTPIENFCLNDS